MNVHPGAIGIFDSGVGGLSVLAEIRRLLPDRPLIYAADGRYCPYGTRPAAEIRERSLLIADELVRLGAALLVVACNTASSVALDALRDRLPVPIIGLEPAVKPAVAYTRTGRVGVLATPRTAAGSRLARLIETHCASVEVRVVPAPGLVDLIGMGQIDGPTIDAALRNLVEPLLNWGTDTIVLGCTHYPFLGRALARLVGPHVLPIDSGEAVARRTRDLLSPTPTTPIGASPIRLMTSGDVRHFASVSSLLLGEQLPVSKLGV